MAPLTALSIILRWLCSLDILVLIVLVIGEAANYSASQVTCPHINTLPTVWILRGIAMILLLISGITLGVLA